MGLIHRLAKNLFIRFAVKMETNTRSKLVNLLKVAGAEYVTKSKVVDIIDDTVYLANGDEHRGKNNCWMWRATIHLEQNTGMKNR